MARLPKPGGDNGNWGAILNDYLSQSHTDDGSLKEINKSTLASDVQASLEAADNAIPASQKGVSDGVAILDSNGKIPLSEIPDDVVTQDELPVTVRELLPGPSVAVSRPLTGEERLSIFASGHGYTNGSGGTGVLAQGTTAPGLGTQYLHMQTAGTATVCRPSSPALASPLNLTNRNVRLMLRFDKPDQVDLSDVALYLSSDSSGWTNFFLATVVQNTLNRAPYWVAGEWASITFDRGAFTTSGTPNWSSIRQVRLAVRDQNGHSIAADWQLVSTLPAASKGIISWTVDDGFVSNQTIMRERLDHHAMPATLYQIAERAIRADAGQDSNSLTTNQLRSLAYNSGWEIAPHAYTGSMHDNPGRYPAYTDDQVTEDWHKLQAWLTKQGLGGATLQQFSWPGGGFDAAKLALARQYYGAGIITWPGHNTLPLVDPYRIRRINTAGPNMLNTLKAHVDRCATYNTWCVFMLHDFIESGTPSGIQMNRSDWEQLVDYVAAANVDVRTVGDVLANG